MAHFTVAWAPHQCSTACAPGRETNRPQGSRAGGGWRYRVVVGLWVGCGWLQGKKKGMGGSLQAKGIGVKEMLTDTINVICLLPQEVDGSLYGLFVPSTFFALALHGLRMWNKPRNCMEEEAPKDWQITELYCRFLSQNFTQTSSDFDVDFFKLHALSSMHLSAYMVSGLFLK